jgi:hypothetical protein
LAVQRQSTLIKVVEQGAIRQTFVLDDSDFNPQAQRVTESGQSLLEPNSEGKFRSPSPA